jgi:hypothetical protein
MITITPNAHTVCKDFPSIISNRSIPLMYLCREDEPHVTILSCHQSGRCGHDHDSQLLIKGDPLGGILAHN